MLALRPGKYERDIRSPRHQLDEELSSSGWEKITKYLGFGGAGAYCARALEQPHLGTSHL